MKHDTDGYECLKCHQTGEHLLKDSQICPALQGATTKKDGEDLPNLESKESLLEALLEEELALSQLIEESMALSLSSPPSAAETVGDPDLEKALALSLEVMPGAKEQAAEELEKAAFSNQGVPTARPEAAVLDELCTPKSLQLMQKLVDMGFNKAHAILGGQTRS